MARALPLPDAVHEEFPRPPLKAMLGQVRFPPILRIADISQLANLQEELRDDFPEFGEEQQVSIALGPEGAVQTTGGRSWRFSTTDGSWGVVLNPTSVTLQAAPDHYTSFDVFRARFGRIWAVMCDELKPARLVYQGLRYINHVEREIPTGDWGQLINPSILGIVGTSEIGGHVAQSLTDVRLEFPDRSVLSIKHGIVQAGPENAQGYLLDFDHFTLEPNGEVDSGAILGRFDVFHDEIHALFHWCLTPAAHEEFRRAG